MVDGTVVELAAEQTHDLRRRVLRVDTPSTGVVWPGDALASTVHLGVVSRPDGELVAIATWLHSPSPDIDAANSGIQLRGMATDPSRRESGFGAVLLDAGLVRARESGADHVWANARSAVLGFYTSHGFEITSDEFESIDTAIVHRRILLRF